MKREKEEVKEDVKEKTTLAPSKILFCDPEVNPFVDSLHLTRAQKVQVVFMSIFIVPLRILMILFAFLLSYIFAFFISIGVAKPAMEPVGRVRTVLFNIYGKFGRVLIFFAGFHRITVKGERAKNVDAPFLIVAPHSSMMDMFMFFAKSPLPSGLSAEKFGYLPFLSTMCKPMLPLFVSRTNPKSKEELAKQINNRVKSPGSWPQFVIFPEGTCTNRKALITFKLSAFMPGVPVQPVVISYSNAYDSFSWSVKSSNPILLIWLSLCQFSIHSSVAFLPTYYPNELEKGNPKLFANNVRAVMAEEANLPCTEHSYEDCRLMWKAEAIDLPLNTGLIEYTTINQKLGVNIQAIEKRLEVFSSIVSDRKSGLMSLADFAIYLEVPLTSSLKKLFNKYVRSCKDGANFKEYLLGYYLIAKPACTEESLERGFKKCIGQGVDEMPRKKFNDLVIEVFGVRLEESPIFFSFQQRNKENVTFEEYKKCLLAKEEYPKLFEIVIYSKRNNEEETLTVKSNSTMGSKTSITSVNRPSFSNFKNAISQIRSSTKKESKVVKPEV